jgi:hypothetical protein
MFHIIHMEWVHSVTDEGTRVRPGSSPERARLSERQRRRVLESLLLRPDRPESERGRG